MTGSRSEIPVSIEELCQNVCQTAASGQIGEPVSFRLHCDVGDPLTDLAGVLLATVAVADAALPLQAVRWVVRSLPSDRLLHVLGVDSAGRTVLLSASRADDDLLSFTLFGNHGTARVEQVPLVAWGPAESDKSDALRQTLRQALESANQTDQRSGRSG